MTSLSDQAREWGLPQWKSSGDLADWLEVSIEDLNWLAWIWRRRDSAHYRHVWSQRDGRRPRLFEVPRPRLKAVQRKLLHGMLAKVPPHPAAHGFRGGRGVASFVAPHVLQDVVLRMDLRHFFSTIRRAWIAAILQKLGYREDVADTLANLTCHRVPVDIVEEVRGELHPDAYSQLRRLLTTPHLPQGAPTSPAFANLASYRLDCRLAGLAVKCGLNYTRYADDMVFSGERRSAVGRSRFRILATAIVMDEGFQVRHQKTRTMHRDDRQSVGGLVVNERPNVPRETYERLRAILFNCVRFGPESQNREKAPDFRAHLLGQIAYVKMVHPAKGERLRGLFDHIDW